MRIEKYFDIDRNTVQQLIDATDDMLNEKSGDNAFQNTKVFLFDGYAVLKMQNMTFRNVTTRDDDLKYLEMVANTLYDLKAKNVNVVPILAFESDDGNGYIIQTRAEGAELYDRDKVSNKEYLLKQIDMLAGVPQKQYDKFVYDTIMICESGVIIDFVGKDNFFYDEAIGFQFIDLNAHYDYEYSQSNHMPDSQLIAAYGCFVPCYFDTMPQYRDTVSQILPKLTDKEISFLTERNRKIFAKCKTAMINNRIGVEMINEAISNERFIPQKHKLRLI